MSADDGGEKCIRYSGAPAVVSTCSAHAVKSYGLSFEDFCAATGMGGINNGSASWSRGSGVTIREPHSGVQPISTATLASQSSAHDRKGKQKANISVSSDRPLAIRSASMVAHPYSMDRLNVRAAQVPTTDCSVST
ncbi:hypothetical protein CTI12_AA053470 [Artemisia annua]|uniref:Uncharacterized protein n=1 Tax=Artemisia annua TaxID=35608 RepID=A0A2U1QAM4_ARTAN|nr:hypothetical protein CTI12_AA053470 [Artemisia annua]